MIFHGQSEDSFEVKTEFSHEGRDYYVVVNVTDTLSEFQIIPKPTQLKQTKLEEVKND